MIITNTARMRICGWGNFGEGWKFTGRFWRIYSGRLQRESRAVRATQAKSYADRPQIDPDFPTPLTKQNTKEGHVRMNGRNEGAGPQNPRVESPRLRNPADS